MAAYRPLTWAAGLLALGVLHLAWVGDCCAEAIVVNNAGFEAPVLDNGDLTTGENIPGWTAIGPDLQDSGVWNVVAAAYPAEAPEGNNVGYLWSQSDKDSGQVGMAQELQANLRALTQYTLEVEIGNLRDFDDTSCNECDYSGFPGYRVEFLAGGTLLAADANTLTPPEGTFATSLVSFSSPADHPNLGDPLEIRLFNLLAGPGIEVDFDNVRLDAIPDVILPGDYNLNGIVDAPDYNVWRDTFGSVNELAADGNGNGQIDAADYNVWRDNFGTGAEASVPEPSSLLLLLPATLAICWGRLVHSTSRRPRWRTI